MLARRACELSHKNPLFCHPVAELHVEEGEKQLGGSQPLCWGAEARLDACRSKRSRRFRWSRTSGRREEAVRAYVGDNERDGPESYMHLSVCVCVVGLNESQCALMRHHKQTMKNESGEAVQLLFPVGTATNRHTYLW